MDYSTTKDIIHSTNILGDSDTAFIDQNIGAIQANWEKRQVFRTETEMRLSVLNDTKFPTPASKYWQCVREQGVFYENLVVLSFDYRRNQIKQQKIQRKIDKCTDNLKLAGLEIDLEEAKFGQLNMEQVAKDRMREIRLWAQIMAECEQVDPSFNTVDVNTHQLLSYMSRWHEQLKGLALGKSSISEVNNLKGQYETALRAVHRMGGVLPAPLRADAIALGVAINSPPPLSVN